MAIFILAAHSPGRKFEAPGPIGGVSSSPAKPARPTANERRVGDAKSRTGTSSATTVGGRPPKPRSSLFEKLEVVEPVPYPSVPDVASPVQSAALYSGGQAYAPSDGTYGYPSTGYSAYPGFTPAPGYTVTGAYPVAPAGYVAGYSVYPAWTTGAVADTSAWYGNTGYAVAADGSWYQPITTGADTWEMHYTDNNEQYFLNTTTGLSQWEDPRGTGVGSTTEWEGYQAAGDGSGAGVDASGGLWVWRGQGGAGDGTAPQDGVEGSWVWQAAGTTLSPGGGRSGTGTASDISGNGAASAATVDEHGIQTEQLDDVSAGKVPAQYYRRPRPLTSSGAPRSGTGTGTGTGRYAWTFWRVVRSQTTTVHRARGCDRTTRQTARGFRSAACTIFFVWVSLLGSLAA